jgi:prohibitin 1
MLSSLSNKARLALGLGAASTAVYSSVYTVKSGQRAVLVDRFHGTLSESVGEGTHFLIPWLQKPYIMDVRARPHTFKSISATTDHEPVNLTLRVISRPDAQRLPSVVQALGVEYDKVLPTIANEVLESVVDGRSAFLFFLNHKFLSDRVKDTFVQRAKDFNIIIDEIDITHFSCTDKPW